MKDQDAKSAINIQIEYKAQLDTFNQSYVNQLRESIKAELDRLKLTQDIKIRSIDGDVPYTGDYLDCIMDITPNGDYTIWNDDSKMTLAYDVTLNYKEDTNIRTLFHILFTLNNL